MISIVAKGLLKGAQLATQAFNNLGDLVKGMGIKNLDIPITGPVGFMGSWFSGLQVAASRMFLDSSQTIIDTLVTRNFIHKMVSTSAPMIMKELVRQLTSYTVTEE